MLRILYRGNIEMNIFFQLIHYKISVFLCKKLYLIELLYIIVNIDHYVMKSNI
jgi:hypothetical protein